MTTPSTPTTSHQGLCGDWSDEETKRAAAELRALFDLIDEIVDAITDDEIEQQWQRILDRVGTGDTGE